MHRVICNQLFTNDVSSCVLSVGRCEPEVYLSNPLGFKYKTTAISSGLSFDLDLLTYCKALVSRRNANSLYSLYINEAQDLLLYIYVPSALKDILEAYI